MGVMIYACNRCEHACFPQRRICHRCGGAGWTKIPITAGSVQEVTTVRHQADAAAAASVHLASVRTAEGVALMVRLDRALAVGSTVTLETIAGGAIVGRLAAH